MLALTACLPDLPHPSEHTMENTTVMENTTMMENTPTLMQEPEPVELPQEEPQQEELPGDLPQKVVTEGDLVNFPNLQAVDPDGDPITYSFTSPLNNEGEWQTSVGDAGQYVVTITASDGTNTVTQDVAIIVNPKNKPPVIGLADINAQEGETLVIYPQVTDPDGDDVTVTYSGFMTSPTKELSFETAGEYTVKITATDGTNTVSKDVPVTIANVNRPPTITSLDKITVKEGELVVVRPRANDPDGDSVTFSFDFPLDENGEWTTKVGDAGDYDIAITASDGAATVNEQIMVVVEAINRAPTIELASPITVKEGQTITLSPVINDPEGDEVRVSYSGWMISNTKQTTFEDAGEHMVAIIARDSAGKESRLDVTVVVENVNRAPSFGTGAFS